MKNRNWIIGTGIAVISFLCGLFVSIPDTPTLNIECADGTGNIQLMPTTHIDNTYVLTTLEPVTCYIHIQ